VAQILRSGARRYVERSGRQAASQVQSTLAKLSLCRTAALGGRKYRCEGCQRECVVYNSCGDRHCPQCAGAKRASWIDSAEQLLLEGVRYFQVVFTLPGALSSLALGNRRVIYDLLFQAAWAALKETIEVEQGYDPAALMVLHTWNQRLESHGHVHAVVPGGGPALDGGGWVNSQRRDGSPCRGAYLVDAVTLRRAYRRHFLAGLDRLRAEKQLRLEGEFEHLQSDEAWVSWRSTLESTEWVSYIEPPPKRKDGETCPPAQVLKYLARYLTGGPISDARIIAADETDVTFWAREGKTTGGDGRRIGVTLSVEEFTRRWSLHILPRGYTKTRRFGGWSNIRRGAYLERCSIQLESAAEPLSADATEFNIFLLLEHDADACDTCGDEETCPVCGGEMRLIDRRKKPSWRDILSSRHRPGWYGAGTWQRQHLAPRPAKRIEFAKGRRGAPPRPTRQSSTPDLSG